MEKNFSDLPPSVWDSWYKGANVKYKTKIYPLLHVYKKPVYKKLDRPRPKI